MISIRNIRIIARYEVKTLTRSWFFRILTLACLIFLFMFNMVQQTDFATTRIWRFIAIPAKLPYINILFLNVVQTVVTVFLASDYLKRDKKLNTTEVIYIRPMSNTDYVLGKCLGILSVFFYLNLFILVLAMVFNLTNPNTYVDFVYYLVYPALLGFPALVFILGLSFFMMSVLHNQAVTFVLILGYIGVTLFYLGNKADFIMDFMGFYMPLYKSDIIGISMLPKVIMQRSIYLFAGIGFIIFTIFKLNRLPQSNLEMSLSVVVSVILLVLSINSAYQFNSYYKGDVLTRQAMKNLNNLKSEQLLVDVKETDINLVHNGNSIAVEAKLSFTNEHDEPLDTVLFRLNKGLKVKEVLNQQGQKMSFYQELHLLNIIPNQNLLPDSENIYTIKYEGSIYEGSCYLDINEISFWEEYQDRATPIDKRYAFVSKDYLLLTPESDWYPMVGVGYIPKKPLQRQIDFQKFKLKVTTNDQLKVISQGKSTNEKGKSSFKTEYEIPGLSVIAGKYETRSITIDSTDYYLQTIEGHDYFASHFDEIGDTIVHIVRDLKQDYERELKIDYPFKRLSLVEVPLQFFTYERLWTEAQDVVQPELVFLPERGFNLRQADFYHRAKSIKEDNKESNEVATKKEVQTQLLNHFLARTFTEGSGRSNFFRNVRRWSNQGSKYSMYPNFYTYATHLESSKWPILHMALESYLGQGKQDFSNVARVFSGLTPEEKVNTLLTEKSLQEILLSNLTPQIKYNAIRSKGNYLFFLLKNKLGEQAFEEFLFTLIKNNNHQAIPFEKFNQDLKDKYNFDLSAQIDEWFTSKEMAGFVIGKIDSYSFIDGDRTRYQIQFNISNTEKTEGVITASFRAQEDRSRRRRRRRGRDREEPAITKIIYLEPNQTKRIGVVMDAPPGNVVFNCLISKNLPMIVNHVFGKTEEKKKVNPFDGELVLNVKKTGKIPTEIIVDNEDPGFKIYEKPPDNVLRAWVNSQREEVVAEQDVKYKPMSYWRPPNNWTLTTMSQYYGEHILSAFYVKSGKGKSKVSWNTKIPQKGYYQVFFYVDKVFAGRQRRSKTNEDGEVQRDRYNGDYHISVYHDDGIEDVKVDISQADYGWYSLGVYYMSQDSAKVELSNQSKGRVVLADAVKWVRK